MPKSFPFLMRSRMCPTEASTAYWRPRNFFRVLVLAGLSTMTRFFAIVGSNALVQHRRTRSNFSAPRARATTLPPPPRRSNSSCHPCQEVHSRGPAVRRARVAAHPAAELQLEKGAEDAVDRHPEAAGDLLGQGEGAGRQSGEDVGRKPGGRWWEGGQGGQGSRGIELHGDGGGLTGLRRMMKSRDQCIKNVLRVLDQGGAVADQGVRSERALVEDPARHRPHLAPEVERVAGGDQRARARRGLDDQGALGERGDHPVAYRKMPGAGREAAGELADQGALRGDLFAEAGVAARVVDAETAAEDGEGGGLAR